MPQVHSHPCFLTPTRIKPTYPLFIFLPGMDGTGQLLRAQTSGLERTFDVRCLAIPPDDLTSWEVLTDKVVALVEEELAKAPRQAVYLCGESFGGCLALKVIQRSPQLFDRLILVNPASSFKRRPWIHWGSHITRWLPEPMYQVSSVGLLPFLSSLGRIGDRDRQALLEAMQSVPQTTSIWRLSLLSQFEMSEARLSQITQPTLVIASAADRLLPSVSEADRLVSLLPNAYTLVLPDSGHACLLEVGVNLYEIMRSQNFLDFPGQNPVMMASSA